MKSIDIQPPAKLPGWKALFKSMRSFSTRSKQPSRFGLLAMGLIGAPATIAWHATPALAIPNCNIFQSGADVVIQGSGSIDLTAATAGPTVNGLSSGGPTNLGGFFSSSAALSSGNPTTSDCTPYQLSAQITTTGFGTGPNSPTFASTAHSTGTYRVAVFGNPSQFGAPFFVIGPNYASGNPISVSTRLLGVSLAQLAFNPTSGLIDRNLEPHWLR